MQSAYGERETVGTQYLEAQKYDSKGLLIGDVNKEMVKGLVDDINEAIQRDPFDGKPFYLNIIEERDLQMKNAIKRRIFNFPYRPYPEDNTLVFYVEPKESMVCFCWELPHHSEMWNILANSNLYDDEYISKIKDWQRNDLTNFGFKKNPNGEHWVLNEFFKDKPLGSKTEKQKLIFT